MTTKFVMRAAERAGVSIETAEHRWKEAKEKVHKGKRRGSWYWGKVMNTFKRMMGLMENVTLQEWLLFEADDEDMFAHWPQTIHLYGPYVAEQCVNVHQYVCYEVEMIMGDKTGIQLAASRSTVGGCRGGAAYTLGVDNDFAQQLGIYRPPSTAGDVNEFKKWAIDAMKTGGSRIGVNEAAKQNAKSKHILDCAPKNKDQLADWPQTIHLYGPYAATLVIRQRDYRQYAVEMMMGDIQHIRIDANVVYDIVKYDFYISYRTFVRLEVPTETHTVKTFKDFIVKTMKANAQALGVEA